MNTLYFIETQTAKLGRWFIECDRDSNSREAAIKLIRSGEVCPVKILEICEDEGTCRDVTYDDDFIQAVVDARLPEILNSVFDGWDRARDLRKHEVA
jgi:hypothetical protein